MSKKEENDSNRNMIFDLNISFIKCLNMIIRQMYVNNDKTTQP